MDFGENNQIPVKLVGCWMDITKGFSIDRGILSMLDERLELAEVISSVFSIIIKFSLADGEIFLAMMFMI